MTAPRPSLPGIVPEAPIGRDALRHPVLWFRAHPMAWDLVLAVVAAAIPAIVWLVGPGPNGVAWRDPDLGLAVAIALTAVPLVWRRTAPLPVLALTLAGSVLLDVRDYNTDYALLGELVALYTVGAHCPKRISRTTLSVVALLLVPLLFWSNPAGAEPTWGEVAAGFLLYGIVWLVGDNLQTRRANVAALHERAERAERDREAEARRAVEAERTRIAREMHDVVAHSMSVMVVQASGARRVLHKHPDQAEQALTMIEQTGREALTEMRRLLGILRDEQAHGAPDRGPQPSLDALDDLVAECAASGLPVEVVRHGEAGPLPPGVDLAAYRIVQEALTNVLRHAGRARATVTVTATTDTVDLEVSDDGRGLSADRPTDGAGHGLVGMRERAALYGGSVTTGPRPGGGFTVTATLRRDPS